MTRNEAIEALQDAREATQAASAAYKAAWKTGKQEIALDVLYDAEASERALKAELAPYLQEA